MTQTVELSSSVVDCWLPADAQCQRWVQQALQTAAFTFPCRVSLRFAAPEESAALNQTYRGKQGACNVLSFPCATSSIPSGAMPEAAAMPLGYRHLGDIVLCPPLVEEEAQQQGKALDAHWAHLTVHGTLHLIGHDHGEATAAAAMEAIEIKSLAGLGFPNPYVTG